MLGKHPKTQALMKRLNELSTYTDPGFIMRYDPSRFIQQEYVVGSTARIQVLHSLQATAFKLIFKIGYSNFFIKIEGNSCCVQKGLFYRCQNVSFNDQKAATDAKKITELKNLVNPGNLKNVPELDKKMGPLTLKCLKLHEDGEVTRICQTFIMNERFCYIR